MIVSYFLRTFLTKNTAAEARRYLGIGEGGDGGVVTETDLDFSNVTTANSTSAQHGLLPKLSGNASDVFKGDGTFGAGGGGSGDVVGPASSVDDRIATFDGATGELIQDSGVGITAVPTQGENDALVGTNGVPATGNPYVTDSDPRNTNSRAPTAHAASHSSAAADPVTVTNLAGYPGGGTTFLRDDGTFAVPPGTGAGTVTSVALTMPTALFDVAGSPVTTNGTLAVTLDNQNANLIFAGPASGGAAAPTMRALVAADIPLTAQAWDVVITKSADQVVTNSTVLVNDTELFTALVANAFYEIQLVLLYSGSATAGDYKFLFTHPNLGTSLSAGYFMNRNAAVTLNMATLTGTATVWPTGAGTVLGTDAAAGNTFMIAEMKFFLRTDATTGNLQYQFANQTGGAGVTSTTRAGSTLKVKRLA